MNTAADRGGTHTAFSDLPCTWSVPPFHTSWNAAPILLVRQGNVYLCLFLAAVEYDDSCVLLQPALKRKHVSVRVH